MKLIVFSGINLFSGGTLRIYQEILRTLVECHYDRKYRIIAFVFNKEDFREITGNIIFIEMPHARDNYLVRLFYEYIYFYFWSKKKRVYTWVAMHDISPNVKAERRFTYCHSLQAFYDMPKDEIKYDFKCYLLSKLYRYFYKINIKKTTVIVQQQWIKEKFQNYFGIDNIIVANPRISPDTFDKMEMENKNSKYTFIYPAYPRVFKNFQIICEACKILDEENLDYQVYFTIDGNENKYSKMLKTKYGHLQKIRWLGIQNRDILNKLYLESDCLLFPSKLETWGLPITEFGCLKKSELLADLEYAHETSKYIANTYFFNPNDASELAKLMKNMICGEREKNVLALQQEREGNCINGWKELCKYLFSDN